MKSRGSAVTFGLFVIVLLGAVFLLLQGRGKTNWGLVAVLLGVLVLRAALFLVNLRQQRRNTQRGKGSVRIETRLGLDDDLPEPANENGTPADPQGGAAPGP